MSSEATCLQGLTNADINAAIAFFKGENRRFLCTSIVVASNVAWESSRKAHFAPLDCHVATLLLLAMTKGIIEKTHIIGNNYGKTKIQCIGHVMLGMLGKSGESRGCA